MRKFDKDRLILGFAGPVLALVVAFVLSTLVLLVSDRRPLRAVPTAVRAGFATATYRSCIINQAGDVLPRRVSRSPSASG